MESFLLTQNICFLLLRCTNVNCVGTHGALIEVSENRGFGPSCMMLQEKQMRPVLQCQCPVKALPRPKVVTSCTGSNCFSCKRHQKTKM